MFKWLSGAVVFLAALATVLTFIFTYGPHHGHPTSSGQAATGNPSVFVNPTSGAGGTVVKVSGEGFPANARVISNFHTEQIGDTTTNGDSKFSNVAVTIPTSFSQFAPLQFYILAVSGAMSAETPFMLTG